MRNSTIIALEAEDHYLRVHLGDGRSALILMRLSDAISELPPNVGAQTHRSWWVAKSAVRGVTKADGRATLALDGPLKAPVSRSFYKALNDAGRLSLRYRIYRLSDYAKRCHRISICFEQRDVDDRCILAFYLFACLASGTSSFGW
jgi:hypothetical protein